MSINITSYNAICNLGNDIETVFLKAISGNIWSFSFFDNYLKDNWIYAGAVNTKLPEIEDKKYDQKCNRLILKTIHHIEEQIEVIISKYGNDRVAVVCATTNSGIDKFNEEDTNSKCLENGNSAEFLNKHLGLTGYYTCVSTESSSGIKAFSTARDIINKNVCDSAIVVCVDTLEKIPLYGFNSQDVLSNTPCLPFSKNRQGMNLAEACAVFLLEKNTEKGIEIMGIGETSNIRNYTSSETEETDVVNTIKEALSDAGITPVDIDYINAHGTGTILNDRIEANAINIVFGENTPVSSTKPMTGYCLGAAAGIETALCCALLDNFKGHIYPNIYDGEVDENMKKIKLVSKEDKFEKCKICMCNYFGFYGANAIIILGKK